ncbi:MAG: alpha/beta hydrolase, partial [Ruminococcus sp.]|nr:alpha/beta hydrolase [Candidatus Copronaster equi]
MLVKTFDLTNKNVTLTIYIQDISDEMPNMKIKPGMLVIPGGGYHMCSDREAEPVAFEFIAKGYNAFILRYSLNEDSKFPKPLDDAVEALKLIRENAEQWHTDPNKIACVGFSAGGHLAAALSTMADEKPNACVLGYPCTLDSISPILANPIPSVDVAVSEQTPPTFIVHASDDGLVPVEHSLKYALALS